MRRGLLEFAIVAGLLALAAASALALRGEEIRAWLGLRPAGAPARSAAGPPPAPPGAALPGAR